MNGFTSPPSSFDAAYSSGGPRKRSLLLTPVLSASGSGVYLIAGSAPPSACNDNVARDGQKAGSPEIAEDPIC